MTTCRLHTYSNIMPLGSSYIFHGNLLAPTHIREPPNIPSRYIVYCFRQKLTTLLFLVTPLLLGCLGTSRASPSIGSHPRLISLFAPLTSKGLLISPCLRLSSPASWRSLSGEVLEGSYEERLAATSASVPDLTVSARSGSRIFRSISAFFCARVVCRAGIERKVRRVCSCVCACWVWFWRIWVCREVLLAARLAWTIDVMIFFHILV